MHALRVRGLQKRGRNEYEGKARKERRNTEGSVGFHILLVREGMVRRREAEKNAESKCMTCEMREQQNNKERCNFI
jgi:hypothetical protein